MMTAALFTGKFKTGMINFFTGLYKLKVNRKYFEIITTNFIFKVLIYVFYTTCSLKTSNLYVNILVILLIFSLQHIQKHIYICEYI